MNRDTPEYKNAQADFQRRCDEHNEYNEYIRTHWLVTGLPLRTTLEGHALVKDPENFDFVRHDYHKWPKFDGTEGRSSQKIVSVFKRREA